MRKLLVKYSLLCLTVLCFSVFSEDTTSTTDSSTSQTTGDSADTTSTTDSSTESTTTDTTSDTTDDSTDDGEVTRTPGRIHVNFFNSSDLELTKISSTLQASCWKEGAPDTIPANGKITFSTTAACITALSSYTDKANGTVEYQAASGEKFTLSLENTKATPRATAANSSSEQYTLKYTEDDDRDDDQILVNYFLTPLASPINFSLIIGSDPQAWRQDNSANPNENQGPWEAYMRNVIAGIKTQSSNKSYMIINGDITEFGRNSQRASFDSIFGALPFNYYWGLGNHDYANNIGYCTDWPNLSYNACARESVDAMATAVIQYYSYMLPGGVDIDWRDTEGSLAYTWSSGNIRFIQLQNYPTYHATLDHWINATRYINDSLDFLQYRMLINEMFEHKAIVINMHDYSDHFVTSSTNAQRDRFKALLNSSSVLAVFAGHTHQAGVFNRNGGDAFFGRVPVFNSGALFKGDFMAVDFKDKCLTAWALNGKTGSSVITTRYGDLCLSDVQNNSTGTATAQDAKVKELLATTATQEDFEKAKVAADAAKAAEEEEAAPPTFQISTRGENPLCLAAVAGANATLADCSKPETFFTIEERGSGYNKIISTTDASLCLKTNLADENISLGACKGNNNDLADLTSMRLWLLPNNQENYLFKNKYKSDWCVQTTGESEKVAEIADCATSENEDSLASQQWVMKRDNIELQPAEDSGQ